VVVPQRAVNELQGNFQVAVVGADSKVAIRTVKPASRPARSWVISEGLQPRERVVVEGLQKVKDGMTVNAKLVSMESPSAQASPADAAQQAEPGPAARADFVGESPSQATSRGNKTRGLLFAHPFRVLNENL